MRHRDQLITEQQERGTGTRQLGVPADNQQIISQFGANDQAIREKNSEINRAQEKYDSTKLPKIKKVYANTLQALSKKTPVVAPKPLIEKKALKAKKRKGTKM